MLQKKLKEDRIFGFDNFDQFNNNYFKKELVAFEEFHKIRQLKYARVKYNNRITKGGGLAHAGAQALNQVMPSHEFIQNELGSTYHTQPAGDMSMGMPEEPSKQNVIVIQ